MPNSSLHHNISLESSRNAGGIESPEGVAYSKVEKGTGKLSVCRRNKRYIWSD